MKKLLTFAATAVAASFASMSAHAIVLDFVAEAAGAERAIANGSTINNFQGTGVNVTFTAGSGNWFPYFDDVSGGKPGGLGVCKAIFDPQQDPGSAGDDGMSDDCNPTSDDNVSVEESIALAFSGDPFTIRDISFYDKDHNALGIAGGNDGMVGIAYNAMSMTVLFSTAIDMARAGAFVGVSDIKFTYMGTEFYIGSISDVPLPGAIPLLLSGIAGLGFASRKRKSA